MKTAFLHFYNRKLVFYVFVFLLLLGFSVISFTEKDSLHLNINQYHTAFFDVFFKYITHLGDGIFAILIILFTLFFRRKWATSFLLSGLLTVIISYVLKHHVFDFFRPTYSLENLHLIEGVLMRTRHSFPSGHTTAAFSMGVLIILFLKNQKWQILVFFLAVLVAISRVYLSQHYVEDVLAGAVLGTLIALFSYQVGLRYYFFKKKPLN